MSDFSHIGPEEALKQYAWADQHPHLSRPQLESTHSWNGKYWAPIGSPSAIDGVQQRLFSDHEVPSPEAHHQLPDEFARDPRTWWHGRITGQNPRLTKKSTSGEGFHAGSEGSANVRLDHNMRRRGLSADKVAHKFPLRLVGEMANTPEQPGSDQNKHRDLTEARKGKFYRNDIEDPGSISVGVPKREGFLATHSEMVNQALARGEYVHPAVIWAAKRGRPLTYRGPLQDDPLQQTRAQIPGIEVPEERTIRRTYQTTSGHQKNVYRFTEHPHKGWMGG